MIIDYCEQNSDEWFMARCGRPTASCFDKILTPKNKKPSTQAINYMYQLAGERLTGYKAESYQNQIMQRGVELEEEARELFEMMNNIEVEQVGLVYPDERKLYSCSPDGLLEDSGLEIKCPAIHTHVSYLLAKQLPDEYVLQVQGSMLVTGFKEWNFMSYYPGLPPFILKVMADVELISILNNSLEDFCKQLDETTAKLKEYEVNNE